MGPEAADVGDSFDGGASDDVGPGGPTDAATPTDAGGSPLAFTVGGWNVDFFGFDAGGPADDALQLSHVREVVSAYPFDLLGLVEVVDRPRFLELVGQLPGMAGLLANDPRVENGAAHYTAQELKPALLYRTSVVTVQSARLILLQDEGIFAGRPPLEVRVAATVQGETTLLTVIVLHLRAQVPAGDSGCWHNRKASADALKAYLDATDPSERVMVLGDWNDDLDSSILAGYASPFDQFLADPGRYTFITRPLTDSHTGSTIWSSDCIDHQLVNQAMLPSFVTDSATVLRPDSFIANYSYTTSDHFPVRSTFLLGSADATPRLRLVAPSSASLEGYTSVTLRWASNRVESLEAAASLDNGANWTIIGSSIPASTGEYCWLVPNVATDSARIRLIDTARPSLSVTSPPLKVAARPGATSKVIINEVLPQPASGDSANEFVELVNTSPNYVDLGLWTLSDSTGTRHTFACGTRVDPGKALAVFGDPDAVPYGRGNAVAASTGGLHFDDAAGEVVLKVRPTLVGDTVSWTSSTAGVSLNRNPDGSAGAPLVPHSQVPGAVGDSSPGLRVDGNPF